MIWYVLPLLGALHLVIQMETLQAEPWRLRASGEQTRLAAESMVSAHIEVAEALRAGQSETFARTRSRLFTAGSSRHCSNASRVLSVFSTNGVGHAAELHRSARLRLSSASISGFEESFTDKGGDVRTLLSPRCVLPPPIVWVESAR